MKRVKDSRSHDEPATAHTPDGLSRRGWIVLVAVTVAVVVVLGGMAAFALGTPSGRAQASGSTTAAETATPATPPLNPRPTRLGLPPRQTSTPPAATVPEQPVATIAAGDCLQTYPSKSAAGYPVVDCASPHLAQLLSKGRLPQAADTAFPGASSLDTQVGDLCEQHLNWDWVAVWNEDVQLDLRYPDSTTRWASGDRAYYCFVYTYSRHELTGSAVAPG